MLAVEMILVRWFVRQHLLPESEKRHLDALHGEQQLLNGIYVSLWVISAPLSWIGTINYV